LEQRLAKVLPLVREANLLAQELHRSVKFTTKLVNIMPESFSSNPIE